MVNKDLKDIENKSKEAMSHVKKLLDDISKVVTRDFGKVKVKFKEGKVIKKAREDLAFGLKKLAKKIEK